MGKFKPARGKGKSKSTSIRGAIPCLVLLVSAMALLSILFWAFVSRGV